MLATRFFLWRRMLENKFLKAFHYQGTHYNIFKFEKVSVHASVFEESSDRFASYL